MTAKNAGCETSVLTAMVHTNAFKIDVALMFIALFLMQISPILYIVYKLTDYALISAVVSSFLIALFAVVKFTLLVANVICTCTNRGGDDGVSEVHED